MSRVPSVLDNRPLLHPLDMNIQSEILYPIQVNQRSTRFVFDNKGILDSNSRINLNVRLLDQETVSLGPEVQLEETRPDQIDLKTMDSITFDGENVQVADGVDPMATSAAAGATVTQCQIDPANIVKLLGYEYPLRVGDIIFGTTTNEVRRITEINTDNIRYEPPSAAPFAALVDLEFFHRNYVYLNLSTDTPAGPPSLTGNYYKGLKLRMGTSIPGDTGGSSVDGLVQAKIIKYVTAAEASGPDFFTGPYVEIENPTDINGDPIGTVAKTCLLGGNDVYDRRCSVYNQFSIYVPAALGVEFLGYYNGWELRAFGNVQPDGEWRAISNYFSSGAEALAEGPTAAQGFIPVLNPISPVAYLSRQSHGDFEWTGYVTVPGSGGFTEVSLRRGFAETVGHYPVSTGVSSLIKRAVLTIGGREISSLDSVGSFNTITNLMKTSEERDKVLFHLEGINDAMVFSDKLDGEDGYITMKRGRGKTLTTKDYIGVPAPLRITTQFETSPHLSVPLSNLIPMLRGVKLPLFAINQEVSLLVEWQDDINGHRLVENLNLQEPYIPTRVNEADVYLMCDYLYFEKEMEMIQQEIETNDWSLPYEDVITIDAQLPGIPMPTGIAPNNYTRTDTNTLLYLGGKTVRSIIVQKQSTNKDLLEGHGNNRMEGIYNSRSFQRPEEYNLYIDNKPVYDVDLRLSGLQNQELSRCFNTHIKVPNARYTLANLVGPRYGLDRREAGYITDKLWLDSSTTTGEKPLCEILSGNQNYFGIQIANAAGVGVTMSNLPLSFRHITERTSENREIEALLYKYYVIIKKGMSISRGGMVNVAG